MTSRDDRRDDDRREPFDDLFEEMNRAMRMMQEEMEELMKRMSEGDNGFKGSIFTKRPGEEPRYETFGGDKTREQEATGPRKGTHSGNAHVDVMEEEDSIKVIADVPGVEKEDIDLKATESVLKITASRGSRSYDEEVHLPAEIDPESSSATYNNGVLEVTLEKDESTKGKDIEIN